MLYPFNRLPRTGFPEAGQPPFPPGEITFEDITSDSRAGEVTFSSLLGTKVASRHATAGNRILGEWLANGARHKMRIEPNSVSQQFLGKLKSSAAEAAQDAEAGLIVKKLTEDFEKDFAQLLNRPAREGLYCLRQKYPFEGAYQRFRCTYELHGCKKVANATDRLAFLVSDDGERLIMRQVYFTMDTVTGLSNICEVEPNENEKLVILTYLTDVTPNARVTVFAIR